MAKKQKKREKSGPAKNGRGTPSSGADAGTSGAGGEAPAEERSLIEELFKHPTLFAAWVSLSVTMIAVVAAIRFRDQMEMGAIREPTSSIFCAAITITLFASYWRQARRESPPDDEQDRPAG